MTSREIDCPYCGNAMVAGTAYVRGAFRGLFLFGMSPQRLWFCAGDGKAQAIIESGDRRASHRCAKCGAITVSSTVAPKTN